MVDTSIVIKDNKCIDIDIKDINYNNNNNSNNSDINKLECNDNNLFSNDKLKSKNFNKLEKIKINENNLTNVLNNNTLSKNINKKCEVIHEINKTFNNTNNVDNVEKKLNNLDSNTNISIVSNNLSDELNTNNNLLNRKRIVDPKSVIFNIEINTKNSEKKIKKSKKNKQIKQNEDNKFKSNIKNIDLSINNIPINHNNTTAIVNLEDINKSPDIDNIRNNTTKNINKKEILINQIITNDNYIDENEEINNLNNSNYYNSVLINNSINNPSYKTYKEKKAAYAIIKTEYSKYYVTDREIFIGRASFTNIPYKKKEKILKNNSLNISNLNNNKVNNSIDNNNDINNYSNNDCINPIKKHNNFIIYQIGLSYKIPRIAARIFWIKEKGWCIQSLNFNLSNFYLNKRKINIENSIIPLVEDVNAIQIWNLKFYFIKAYYKSKLNNNILLSYKSYHLNNNNVDENNNSKCKNEDYNLNSKVISDSINDN